MESYLLFGLELKILAYVQFLILLLDSFLIKAEDDDQILILQFLLMKLWDLLKIVDSIKLSFDHSFFWFNYFSFFQGLQVYAFALFFIHFETSTSLVIPCNHWYFYQGFESLKFWQYFYFFFVILNFWRDLMLVFWLKYYLRF